ncbi:DUF2805 domain-containing protein [Flavobacterium araucananum]|uniref:DUF2805 domain-containing protein n=1 Tax=Flavobacterium araucananum TaxID=946678 RepID=UPI00374465A2
MDRILEMAWEDRTTFDGIRFENDDEKKISTYKIPGNLGSTFNKKRLFHKL